MLAVMHAAPPPLPLQIVVDVYVAQPDPLYSWSVPGSGGSVAVAQALVVMQTACPPLPLQTVVGVYEAHVEVGGSVGSVGSVGACDIVPISKSPSADS